MPAHLVERFGIETGLAPKDITGAAQVGAYISLRDYAHITIIITQGAWAGGTPAVTLEQATAVAGTASKALGFVKRWTKVGLTGVGFVETVVTSNTFNLPNVAHTINVIEVEASELDTDNDFDCIVVKIATPGTNADLLFIQYILSGARYPQAVMSNPKVD